MDVGAILGNGGTAGRHGEHTAGAESGSARTGGGAAFAGALGGGETGTVTVLRRTAVRGCTRASIILELDNVEEGESFGFSGFWLS